MKLKHHQTSSSSMNHHGVAVVTLTGSTKEFAPARSGGAIEGLTIPSPCIAGNSCSGGCSHDTAVWTVVTTWPCAGERCWNYGGTHISPPRRILPLSPVSATWRTAMVLGVELYPCACCSEVTITSVSHPSFVSRGEQGGKGKKSSVRL